MKPLLAVALLLLALPAVAQPSENMCAEPILARELLNLAHLIHG